MTLLAAGSSFAAMIKQYRFQDGQFERHRTDGSKEIQFPNGTHAWLFSAP